MRLEQLIDRTREWLEREERDAYRDNARYRLKNKINDEFDNYDMAHARILASVMIGECSEKESVRIYSGTLMNECYDDALRKSQASSIKVLLDGINNSNISSLAWLKETPAYKKGVLEIRIIEDMKKMASENGIEIPEGHFFFTSANAYRKETDHEKVMARVNFYDPVEVSKLSWLFDRWFALGIPVNL